MAIAGTTLRSALLSRRLSWRVLRNGLWWLPEVAELAGSHHRFDRRAGLQVAGERHRLRRIVPTEGVRQGVDQRIHGGGVGVVVVADDPGPAPRVEDFGNEIGMDQLADLYPGQVGGAYRDAVGSPGTRGSSGTSRCSSSSQVRRMSRS